MLHLVVEVQQLRLEVDVGNRFIEIIGKGLEGFEIFAEVNEVLGEVGFDNKVDELQDKKGAINGYLIINNAKRTDI